MKTFTGKVVSTKMQQTIIVQIEWVRQHPQYKKIVRGQGRIAADCTGKEVHEGDTVILLQVRPISKNKHFIVQEVVKKHGTTQN